MIENKRPCLTVRRLTAIPGLVHGFGDGRWSEADFMAFAAAREMRPVIMHQLHSDIIRRLDAAPAEKLEGDALMTNVPGLLLVIRTADCLPVFLVDAKSRAVAAVHCGWRGTQKRILEKVIGAMGQAYGSKPVEMLAALGPCIGPACYEVGPEVRDGFLRAGFPPSVFKKRGHVRPGADSEERPAESRLSGRSRDPDKYLKRAGKFLLDLRAANVWLLEGLGFDKANIFNSGPACTHCAPSFLSYRRDPRESRRMYNFIGLAAG